MKKHSDERHPDLELALQRIEPFRPERIVHEMPSGVTLGASLGVIGDLSSVIARIEQGSPQRRLFCTYDPTECSEAA
jgi:hypothetical protein